MAVGDPHERLWVAVMALAIEEAESVEELESYLRCEGGRAVAVMAGLDTAYLIRLFVKENRLDKAEHSEAA